MRKKLFSPRILGHLRGGQLTLGDIEENLAHDSFAAIIQQRGVLDRALTKAFNSALEAELEDSRRPKADVIGDVIAVAIAYLAGRILEDKEYFGDRSVPEYDPLALIREVTRYTNGFFQKTLDDNLPRLHLPAQQALAAHLGHGVTFSLIDHRDVGRLYEHLNSILSPSVRGLPTPEQRARFNLQQHYTPLALAQRMLDHLPLERLRPEERVVFDPAAGSGTLLLAASRRLGRMADCLAIPDLSAYLARSVMGNDLDPWAPLMTKLRYQLIAQIVGSTNVFPSPQYFGNHDYESPTGDAWKLPARPRVIVANPPYEEDSNTQRVVRFLEIVTQRMQDGDYFAFVLPQSFLTATTHGWPDARVLLNSRSHIFDTWLLPEGTVGLTARHPVCVVTGEVGQATSIHTMARRVITGAQINRVRSDGYLGEAWVTKVEQGPAMWKGVLAPKLVGNATTVPLERLFAVYIGVTPMPRMPLFEVPLTDVPCKKYWLHGWKRANTLYADPRRIPKTKRYVRYTQADLKDMALAAEWVFDLPKVLVGRSTNWNSNEPMPVRLDTIGLCPNNDVYCVLPRLRENEEVGLPTDWLLLDSMSKLYWVLGILRSPLGQEISLQERNARHLSIHGLRSFPLPQPVDPRIIHFVAEAIKREQETPVGTEEQEQVVHDWSVLDQLVAESYQIQNYHSSARTGISPDAEAWERERQQPSIPITGQVLEIAPGGRAVRLLLHSLEDEAVEGWVPLPSELPGWSLDGSVFSASMSESVTSLADFQQRPWALHTVEHSPTPYLSLHELQAYFLTSRESVNDY